MKKSEEEPGSFKLWITKVLMIFFILMVVVWVIERNLDVPIVVDTLIAIILVLAIGFTHEGLHYWMALRLGYKPKWYRTKLTMGFEISHHTNRATWLKHKKLIAIAPYIFLVPLSAFILLIGISMDWHLGLTVAGIGGLLLHLVSLPMEGKDV